MSDNKKIKNSDETKDNQPLLEYAEAVSTENTDGVESLANAEDAVAKKKKEKKQKTDKAENKEAVSESENTPVKKTRDFGGEIRINIFGIFIGAAVLIILSVFITFFVAGKVYEGKFSIKESKSVTFAQKETKPASIAKFQEIIDFIDQNYYTTFDSNELIEGAIEGMVEKLEDNYSAYYGPSEMDSYTSFIEGTYSGVGITVVDVENGKEVKSVNKGSPAEKAGVKNGDIITAVNGKKLSEMAESEFSTYFAKEGNSLKIEFILNDGSVVTRDIKVEKIKEETVSVKDLEGGLKYIRISQFIIGTADDFRLTIDKVMLGDSCKGIILDLRNNPGGYANEASKVADMLLPEGIIATTKDRSGKVVETIKSGASSIDVPMVILINQNTASAAELVTGAFRDFKKGEIVGVKSYGKALGQRNKVFKADGSGIVLSTSRYYTPSGECIDGVGIKPTKVVELDEAYTYLSPENIPEGKDLQLYAAMEALGVSVEVETEPEEGNDEGDATDVENAEDSAEGEE